jgi:hypothetical protein
MYNNILCVISFCSHKITKTYARPILQRIDKCIEITRRGSNDKKNKNNNDLSIDIRIHSNGAVFILRGKTGERRLRIVSFTKLLQRYIIEKTK